MLGSRHIAEHYTSLGAIILSFRSQKLSFRSSGSGSDGSTLYVPLPDGSKLALHYDLEAIAAEVEKRCHSLYQKGLQLLSGEKLDPDTIKHKRYMGYPQPERPLYATGYLMNNTSITRQGTTVIIERPGYYFYQAKRFRKLLEQKHLRYIARSVVTQLTEPRWKR